MLFVVEPFCQIVNGGYQLALACPLSKSVLSIVEDVIRYITDGLLHGCEKCALKSLQQTNVRETGRLFFIISLDWDFNVA